MTDVPAESVTEDVLREYVRRYLLIESGAPMDEGPRRLAAFMEYQRHIETLGADDLRALLKHSAWVVSRIVLDRADLAGRSSLDQWDYDLAVINAARGVRDIERFLSAEDGTPDEDNEGGET